MSEPEPVAQTELDHLAIAAPDLTELLQRYAGDLGAGWVGMGPDEGLSFAQVRFGNGRRLEMLEPRDDGQSGTIWRFVDGNRPGPHHLTFRVTDIHAKARTIEDAGFRLVWGDEASERVEAFLDPEEAMGVVVRLEEMRQGTPTPITPVPDGVAVPPTRVDHAAHLDWIGLAVASLEDGMRLFAELLDGTETERGEDDDANDMPFDAEWVELEWPHDGRIRLYTPASASSPLVRWLGGRSGRLHHIALSVEQPGAIPDAVGRSDGPWEVPPDQNEGVRLLLRARQATKQEGGVERQGGDVAAAAPDVVILPEAAPF